MFAPPKGALLSPQSSERDQNKGHHPSYGTGKPAYLLGQWVFADRYGEERSRRR